MTETTIKDALGQILYSVRNLDSCGITDELILEAERELEGLKQSSVREWSEIQDNFYLSGDKFVCIASIVEIQGFGYDSIHVFARQVAEKLSTPECIQNDRVGRKADMSRKGFVMEMKIVRPQVLVNLAQVIPLGQLNTETFYVISGSVTFFFRQSPANNQKVDLSIGHMYIEDIVPYRIREKG